MARAAGARGPTCARRGERTTTRWQPGREQRPRTETRHPTRDPRTLCGRRRRAGSSHRVLFVQPWYDGCTHTDTDAVLHGIGDGLVDSDAHTDTVGRCARAVLRSAP